MQGVFDCIHTCVILHSVSGSGKIRDMYIHALALNPGPICKLAVAFPCTNF